MKKCREETHHEVPRPAFEASSHLSRPGLLVATVSSKDTLCNILGGGGLIPSQRVYNSFFFFIILVVPSHPLLLL